MMTAFSSLAVPALVAGFGTLTIAFATYLLLAVRHLQGTLDQALATIEELQVQDEEDDYTVCSACEEETCDCEEEVEICSACEQESCQGCEVEIEVCALCLNAECDGCGPDDLVYYDCLACAGEGCEDCEEVDCDSCDGEGCDECEEEEEEECEECEGEGCDECLPEPHTLPNGWIPGLVLDDQPAKVINAVAAEIFHA